MLGSAHAKVPNSVWAVFFGRGSALCTRAGPNAILGPALLGSRLALGHP